MGTHLVLVQLAVLVLPLALVLEGDDDEAHEDVHHEEGDDDDEDDEEQRHALQCHSVQCDGRMQCRALTWRAL